MGEGGLSDSDPQSALSAGIRFSGVIVLLLGSLVLEPVHTAAQVRADCLYLMIEVLLH